MQAVSIEQTAQSRSMHITSVIDVDVEISHNHEILIHRHYGTDGAFKLIIESVCNRS